MTNLSNALHTRTLRKGSSEDLDRAITLADEAVKTTPNGDPNRVDYLNNLSNVLELRYERLGSPIDSDRPLSLYREIVELSPKHPNKAAFLNNLGKALLIRFERTGSIDVLNEAVSFCDEAVLSTPNGHSGRATYLTNLGNGLHGRFEWLGTNDDLTRAIDAHREAVQESSSLSNDPNRGMHFNGLGRALGTRFEQTGSKDDLNQSMALLTKAVEITPTSHTLRFVYINNLATALRNRFKWLGSMEDLDQAITVIKNNMSTSVTKETDPNRGMHLNNLSTLLLTRYERTKLIKDLDEAVAKSDEAIACCSKVHRNRVIFLTNLGNALITRSYLLKTTSLEDLDHGIDAFDEVVQSTPYDHPSRALYLNNLAAALRIRFQRKGSMEDLNHAIDIYEDAVKLVATSSPDKGLMLNNKGAALELRFERTGSSDDLDRAISAHKQAVSLVTVPPTERIQAASRAASLLQSYGPEHVAEAARLLRIAVELLPLASPRALKRDDQQYIMSTLAPQGQFIASRAAALSLEVEDEPYEALQLLELGRGVIAGMLLDIRTDITALKEEHPILAQRFEQLRNKLDSPLNQPQVLVDESSYYTHLASTTTRREALSKEFDSLLKSIRSMENFKRFLLGPTRSELMALAGPGTIIVFNVAPIRSDAILVTNKEIRSLPLPKMDYKVVQQKTESLRQALQKIRLATYEAVRKEMCNILEWLWMTAMDPVLRELGFTKTLPSENWPRVWWVASGSLSLLPIHAAGVYSKPSPENVLNRVISSYTPTIKSLAHARERTVKLSRDENVIENIYVFGMSKTPGVKKDLPYVDKEVEMIKSIDAQSILNLAPTKAIVLSSLENCRIVHFACHGQSDYSDPSRSRLLLQDWQHDPLSVADIVGLKLEYAKFAYLSCCHAANQRVESLFDEGIHMTGAFQLAGFSHVVGTLWQITDEQAVEVSRSVYEVVLNSKDRRVNVDEIAQALHTALRQLREKTRRSRNGQYNPLIWAPYVYFGA